MRGQFREDLCYRINVIAVQVPPLRDRREDILWLADRMLTELRPGRRQRNGLSLAAQQALFVHAWPGNVRELNHLLRRALALSAGPVLEAADLFADGGSIPGESAALADDTRSLSEHLERTERAFLMSTLQTHRGAITEAAARLGISRKTLWEKMRRHGIDKQQFGADADGPLEISGQSR